jgi:hypothetical protein
MLEIHDLAGLAEAIDTAYRPRPLASLLGLEVSLMVAEGQSSWFRQVAHDELLLVLEGVVTLDAPRGKVVLNEGELATAERNTRHHVHSGMRSTVLLFEEVRDVDLANGHRSADLGVAGQLEKRNPAVAVMGAEAFDWLSVGASGAYEAHATRVLGVSAPYTVPAGSMAAVVYRGVLDYEVDGQGGAVVGSQMLVARPDCRLTLRSERGATVVLVARRGVALPGPAGPAASTPGGERSGRPEP